MNESCQGARYKFNTQKPVVFLYTCKEQSEMEMKKTIPLNIASE
jgi:hypothetical protein